MDDKLKKILAADLLKTVGLEHAAPEIRENALADAKNKILEAVVCQIRVRLSREIREEFERLFGAEDDAITEKNMEFLKQHVPDLDALIITETLAFKKGVLDAAKEIQRKSSDEAQKINDILNRIKE